MDIKEDVVDYRSLSNIKTLEFRHLRLKCQELDLEAILKRYCQLSALSNVSTFVVVIEFLLVIHIILLFLLVKHISIVSVIPYAVVMLLTPLITLPSRKRGSSHYYGINMATSWVMALIFVLADIFVSLWVEYPLMPCYDHVVLVSVYMFLPITLLEHGRVYLLGVTVSLIYFLYMVWNLRHISIHIVPPLVLYASYLIFLNMVLYFFTVVREFYGRRSVLCRYQLVYQNIVFNMAMMKVKALVESIMPFKMTRTLEEDIANRIGDKLVSPGDHVAKAGLLYLEPHPEVSILVADMVNYTNLTTTLKARELVEIFHELFVNYEVAANRNRTVRIKFQGDAYSCVAGIPSYFPAHAACCLDQALEMIRITEGLSRRRGLNINLRIGVHSGEVVAGIIGHTKWQFDIWSPDVDITNRLESSGRPGLVHVSNTTLSLLGNEYFYEAGTEQARNDPILQRAQITSYLVSRQTLDLDNKALDMGEDLGDPTLSSYSLSSSSVYEEIQLRAMREMIQEVEHMPVGREPLCRSRKKRPGLRDSLDNEYLFNTQSHYLFTIFRSWKMEWRFHNQPDLVMKYSLMLVLFAGVTVFLMSRVTSPAAFAYPIMLGGIAFLLLLCLGACYKKLWLQCSRLTPVSQPSCFLSRWLFKFSELIERSILLRVPVAILVLLLCYGMTSYQAFNCDIAKLEMEIIAADLHHAEVKSPCFMPWAVTYAVVAVLSLLFVIIGVPLIFKLGIGLTIVGLHLGTIHAYYGFAFERSRTTDRGLRSDYAHTWYLVTFLILLLVRERRLAYIMKAMFFMHVCYEKKQLQTQTKRRSMKIIMANLLPSHVIDVFKERRRNDQLYYEKFFNVAIMFASIENFELDRAGLRVLHEFVCYFDDVLANYQSKYKIEKIKVKGWTYVAACGLAVDYYTDYTIDIPTGSENDTGKRSRPASIRFAKVKEKEPSTSQPSQDRPSNDDDVVSVITKFALDLLRKMNEIRLRGLFIEYDSPLKSGLKIGISHGPVKAGVVGLSKPHYDVWGRTVNMASAMNSTGLLDSIHVTEITAQALRQFNVRCNYRGQTQVEGVGEVPTYLVALSDHLEFIYINENVDGPQGSITKLDSAPS